MVWPILQMFLYIGNLEWEFLVSLDDDFSKMMEMVNLVFSYSYWNIFEVENEAIVIDDITGTILVVAKYYWM